MIKVEKYTYLLFCSLLIMGFCIGYGNTLSSFKPQPTNINVTKFATIGLATKILLHNGLFSLLIILGFISFNISNVLVFFYNGLVLGISYKSAYLARGHLKTILLVFPHGIFELFAFYQFFKVSIMINQMIINHIRYNNFVEELITQKGLLLKILKKAILFLIISSFIETFITPIFL